MSMSSSTTLQSIKSESPYQAEPDSNTSPQRPHDEENPPPTAEDKEVKKEKEEGDAFLVDWDSGEKANPRNWSTTYKSWITFQLGMLALCASLGSSIISPAETVIAEYTGISTEVAVLVISMYILG